jgi:hypothetical protein
MIGQIIGHREFVDGTCRPVYEDARGQYVLDDDVARVYGVWLLPEDDDCEAPLIVEPARPAPASGGSTQSHFCGGFPAPSHER